MLLPLVKVDLGAMTMKGYFTFSKSPNLQGWSHTIRWFLCYWGGGLTTLQRFSLCFLLPQPTKLQQSKIKSWISLFSLHVNALGKGMNPSVPSPAMDK